MTVNHYRFRSVWPVAAATDRVFDALVDLTSWPRWWPDVRSVHRVDEDTAELVCRSTLPYSLVFRLHRRVQDERSGRLRVDLTGDLEGVTEGVVERVVGRLGTGARLAIDQRVEVTRWSLRVAAPIARPLFVANHALMMRRGHRGLVAYLG